MIDRRKFLAANALAMAAAPIAARGHVTAPRPFPDGFLWGAATAGHQVEGNNISSDLWFLENLDPTAFREPSGDADNSFALWPVDLDLVKAMGLNCYRFSLEWARIEPERGQYSQAMIDHYKAMIAGCHQRGLAPVVTFNHFTSPRWFGAMGGWTNAEAPKYFARFCERAAAQLAGGIDHAVTFNEPNILLLLQTLHLPPQVREVERQMLETAARMTRTPKFTAANMALEADVPLMQQLMLEGHAMGKAAIKAQRRDLPVGVTLAMFDDQAAGKNSIRDAMRRKLYGHWLDAAKADDYLGVQNYERSVWNAVDRLPPPPGAVLNHSGAEVYAPSLAGAVRYAHEATGVPILVTEHGVGTADDSIRARFIPAALVELQKLIAGGVPVKGYIHWSLLDNFEWIFGYGPQFGLHSVDRETFVRTPKPSAAVLGAIARANAV